MSRPDLSPDDLDGLRREHAERQRWQQMAQGADWKRMPARQSISEMRRTENFLDIFLAVLIGIVLALILFYGASS